jgi:hypothetical protein
MELSALDGRNGEELSAVEAEIKALERRKGSEEFAIGWVTVAVRRTIRVLDLRLDSFCPPPPRTFGRS